MLRSSVRWSTQAARRGCTLRADRLLLAALAAALPALLAGCMGPLVQTEPGEVVPTDVGRVIERDRGMHLFPLERAPVLDRDERDGWQLPERVLDVLEVGPASALADIGAGTGYFTLRAARRVGPEGVIYAVDVQPGMLLLLEQRLEASGYENVTLIRGEPGDPRLPEGELDVVLLVNAYHQVPIEDAVPLLARARAALGPEGRLAVIDWREDSPEGPPVAQRVLPETVVDEARGAGLELIESRDDLPYQYFLLFAPADILPAGD